MNLGISCRLGASILAAAAAIACDGGSASEPTGSSGAAGMASTAGTAGMASTAGMATIAGSAGAVEDQSLPLAMSQGRVSNAALEVHGAVLAEADTHTAQGMTSNLTPPVAASVVNACIKGEDAKIDQASEVCVTKMFTAPATDCWSEYRGANIGMYLNQPSDSAAADSAQPFDASLIKGFSFEIDGPVVPGHVALRFQVEADNRQFCNPGSLQIGPGTNRVLLEQLVEECFRTPNDPALPSAESVQSKLLKLSWWVVPNDKSAVPFDFCVSNVRALLK